ncbi:MAG TPA: hypothetical protein VF017_02435 [Thermoanaerobaculia bacterium]|nr:hypothetical protein [Thermoanaerobaculia bacterium]
MSCPSWPALLAERERTGGESEALRQALAHLATCRSCRDDAYRADPLLVFRRLPKVEAGEADVEAMRRAVATLRRANAVETAEAASPPARAVRFGVRPGFLRGLAAASLLLALTWAPSGLERLARAPGASAPATGIATATPVPGGRRFAPGVLPASLEDLDLPEARVYELSADELQLVMIVDPSLNL